MKQRFSPVIFSEKEISELLLGHKTTFHREITVPGTEASRRRPFPPDYIEAGGKLLYVSGNQNRSMEELCPYGQVGDLLWVQEVWSLYVPSEGACPVILYRQSCIPDDSDERQGYWLEDVFFPSPIGWRSPITMPRWISRFTLQITKVCTEKATPTICKEDPKLDVGSWVWCVEFNRIQSKDLFSKETREDISNGL